MSSSGTPSVSAAIWANTVSDPVPRSVAPTSTLKLPSSFIFILAAPMSSPGIAVPCIQTAIPSPRRMYGLSSSIFQVISFFRDHSISSCPILIQSVNAHEVTICGSISLSSIASPSPIAPVIGIGSPSCTALCFLKSIGSIFISKAISSIRHSSANSA